VERGESITMTIFKARVQDGRLVLDEPTELPEGQIVYLQAFDAASATDGGMTEDEREDLFQALDEAIESVQPPADTDDEPSNDARTETVVESENAPATPQS
jgi:hypothetical protein